jgi:hypothetical protein
MAVLHMYNLKNVQGMKIPSYTDHQLTKLLSKQDMLDFLVGINLFSVQIRLEQFINIKKKKEATKMLLKKINELKPEIEKFCTKTKTAVLVEESTTIENYCHPIIIHFFNDSKTVMAKGVTLAFTMMSNAKALSLPNNKFYVVGADNMTNTDILAILKSSQNTQIDWFIEQKELSPCLCLNNLLFEKKTHI